VKMHTVVTPGITYIKQCTHTYSYSCSVWEQCSWHLEWLKSVLLSEGLEELKQYNISLYPIYKHRLPTKASKPVTLIQAGLPVTIAAYIQQDCMYLRSVTYLNGTVKLSC